jgi:hypothetical protein
MVETLMICFFTGININRVWKDDKTWFGQYAATYAGATLNGSTPENAHCSEKCSRYRWLLPGSAGFKSAFNQVTNEASVLSGSKLVDNSKIYHSDANYNFKDLIKFAEIQVGGS